MKGGLSIILLSFGKNVPFHESDISFYRDINTSEALNDFLSYFLIDKHGCQFEVHPTYETIGSYYSDGVKLVLPPEQHAITDCFFSHMFVWERDNGRYPIVYLVKLENNFLIVPLFRDFLSYPPESLCQIKEEDSPFLFEQMTAYSSHSFDWQIENAWISGLKRHLDVEKNVLVLANLTPICSLLCHMYESLLKEFKTFPCTRGEESRQQVLNYLTSVYEFLKV